MLYTIYYCISNNALNKFRRKRISLIESTNWLQVKTLKIAENPLGDDQWTRRECSHACALITSAPRQVVRRSGRSTPVNCPTSRRLRDPCAGEIARSRWVGHVTSYFHSYFFRHDGAKRQYSLLCKYNIDLVRTAIKHERSPYRGRPSKVTPSSRGNARTRRRSE